MQGHALLTSHSLLQDLPRGTHFLFTSGPLIHVIRFVASLKLTYFLYPVDLCDIVNVAYIVCTVPFVRRCWAPVEWRHSKLCWWWWWWWPLPFWRWLIERRRGSECCLRLAGGVDVGRCGVLTGETVVRRRSTSAHSYRRQRGRASASRQRPASQPLLQTLPAARQKVTTSRNCFLRLFSRNHLVVISIQVKKFINHNQDFIPYFEFWRFNLITRSSSEEAGTQKWVTSDEDLVMRSKRENKV